MISRIPYSVVIAFLYSQVTPRRMLGKGADYGQILQVNLVGEAW